jgi:hypothetical protein
MKNKFFVLGMLVMALALGFVFVGCDNGTTGDGLSKVATPTANPAAGTVLSGTEIALSSSTSGAMIYYTTDGTSPGQATGTAYPSSKPTITATTTIKAIAYKDGMTDSDVLTAAYTIANFSNPPTTIADTATAKAYFEIIWDEMPTDWQTFFMTLWAEEGADGGGTVPTDLDDIDNEHWEEMVEGWPNYQQVWPALYAKMEANESPVAAPPVWPSNGTAIKTYVEGIWDDLTEDWRDYYLETIMYYYNALYNSDSDSSHNSDDTISLPTNLDDVSETVWNKMKEAWNGRRWMPEDAQHIFESLVLAINVLGMSPGDPGLDDFICAGIRE